MFGSLWLKLNLFLQFDINYVKTVEFLFLVVYFHFLIRNRFSFTKAMILKYTLGRYPAYSHKSYSNPSVNNE